MAFGHFLLVSHKFMVTAIGSCVKWPYVHLGIAHFNLDQEANQPSFDLVAVD